MRSLCKTVIINSHMRSKLAFTFIIYLAGLIVHDSRVHAIPQKNNAFVNFNQNVNVHSLISQWVQSSNITKVKWVVNIISGWLEHFQHSDPPSHWNLNWVLQRPKWKVLHCQGKLFQLYKPCTKDQQLKDLCALVDQEICDNVWKKCLWSHYAVVSIFHTSVMYMLIGFWSVPVNAKHKAN